ncbi:AAA family ATPase [Mycolicibacterium obuense]|uniref:AAA family ATPase n=1 Tax=Mycolicibacterium obuense TaxID=1807 RepID=UPI0009E35382|nr:AAA family ATPase [Mycolicibacterium obuense]
MVGAGEGEALYLRELFIKNSGPIKDVHLELAFTEDDRPLPHVVVGLNGAGKTNFLSLISDALMEGASEAFNDVLNTTATGRNYFRIVGGATISYGETIGFTILRFTVNGQDRFYHENLGNLSTQDAKILLPESLEPGANWEGTDSSKSFNLSQEEATSTFGSNVHAFFPSSRSEHPFWFNREAFGVDEYDLQRPYSGVLARPLFVEQGTDAFAQWLLGVITEARWHPRSANYVPGTNQQKVNVEFDSSNYLASQAPLVTANALISTIMDVQDAKFVWNGRRNSRKVGVVAGNRRLALGLDSLSGGQATLLAIFGTILRYADAARDANRAMRLDEIEGIVVIDELDAHMHMKLQMEALPKLIAMFPRVQFIVSSHSPFFALGMEKTFTSEGVRIVDLPTGLFASAESYNEFGIAFEAVIETNAFEKKVGEFLAAAESPLIWVGGETDVIYFNKAAEVLGYSDLIDAFEWVGTFTSSGKNMHSGDSGMNSAYNLLKANPNFTNRPVVLLYDADANKSFDSFGSVRVLSYTKMENAHCEKGVENLLPTHLFTADMYEEESIENGYGKPGVKFKLRKMQLCESVCGNDADAANFENFRPTLDALTEALGQGADKGPDLPLDPAAGGP